MCNLSMKCISYPFNSIKILCHTHELQDFCNFSIPGVEAGVRGFYRLGMHAVLGYLLAAFYLIWEIDLSSPLIRLLKNPISLRLEGLIGEKLRL